MSDTEKQDEAVMGFTPGEWKAGRADMATIVEGYEGKYVYADGNYVAAAIGDAKDWDEIMANAHLIAAAPALYHALNELLMAHSTLDGSRHDGIVMNMARAALAAARGEAAK